MKKYFLLLVLLLTANHGFAQFFFENPVTWQFTSKDMGNGVHELYFTGSIESPWYVYAIELEQEGPIPTSVEFENKSGYTTVGELVEITKSEIKYDPGFQFDIGMYSGKVELMQKIQISSANEVVVEGYVEFQCCNDETCLPPFQENFKFTLPGITALTAETGTIQERENETAKVAADNEALAGTDPATPYMEDKPDEITGDTSEAFLEEFRTQGESQSLFLFLLIAFLAGLAAILTPCVFPMIPMTVSFFIRGSSSRTMAVLKGLVFGFSMILVYTGLGVIVSLTGLGAEAGVVISTHWIPNLLFFLLFTFFAASFLGMFELVLPSGIINKADKQADKGGLTGAFFMGITTVLVSFSCTGPIVGSLLIESAGGLATKPILGMFFFSLAFAIPFTLLAIFPSMLKNLPKSGGWLNSIKVVLGFIVLAFGMKFLIAIDQSYHLRFISREIYLAIWFILAILLGLYFLGRIKFANDNDLPYVSVPRFALALASFTFAVYLFTGILGADLRTIAPLIPPKSASAFSLAPQVQQITDIEQNSTYCGPGKYDERFTLPHGLKGYFYYEDGINCAIEKNKPIFLDFTGHSCSNCKQMENQVWSDPGVLRLLKEEFVVISLYTDDRTRVAPEDIIIRDDGRELRTIGEINMQLEIDMFGTIATPLYVLLDHEGNLLAPPTGKDLNIQSYTDFLLEGLSRFN